MVVRWLRLSLALGLLLAAYVVAPATLGTHAEPLVRLTAVATLLAATAGVMVRQLRLSLDDTERHVDGLVLAVTLFTLVFAQVFHVLEQRHPGQVEGLETKVDALYFTLSTMLTVGYGDVHATGQAARLLVIVQMVLDVVLVAAAAAMLSARVRRAAAARRGDARP